MATFIAYTGAMHRHSVRRSTEIFRIREGLALWGSRFLATLLTRFGFFTKSSPISDCQADSCVGDDLVRTLLDGGDTWEAIICCCGIFIADT